LIHDHTPEARRRSRAVRGQNSEDAADELPDVLQFMQLLWAIVHALQTRSKAMSSSLGVTGPQRLVLRVVGLFPGVSPGRLASVLHLHPSTLTGVLQRLVAQGLLRRTVNSSDGRKSVLALTTKGARVNASRQGTVEAAVAAALARVGAADRRAAQKLLLRLATCLADSDRC
jgi:MarR family transcriptional regulator, organic hydroperoxide resistance regulator